jgi:putative tryptophan/tyrosine transport system substrate-binding protein
VATSGCGKPPACGVGLLVPSLTCGTLWGLPVDSQGRRDFLALLGGMAAAWPLAARAQQTAMALIGLLSARSPAPPEMAALQQGLAENGYAEGRNVEIEYRWADGKFDRLPAMAADLVQRRVAVIIATGLTSAVAAKAATTTIPLVFMAADDPVKFGLVASLSRPGGNATGVNLLTSELTTKRLEFVRELLPAAVTVAVLVNPRSPESEPQLRDLQATARAIGQQLRILNASSEPEIEAAFAILRKERNAALGDAALLVTNDPLFTSKRDQLVALAASHSVPTVYDRRGYAAAGGLMSYGTDYLGGYRKLGIYASKILNGAKPADLPVEQSTRFELVINVKTAKALGLDVPPMLIARADEVIE